MPQQASGGNGDVTASFCNICWSRVTEAEVRLGNHECVEKGQITAEELKKCLRPPVSSGPELVLPAQ